MYRKQKYMKFWAVLLKAPTFIRRYYFNKSGVPYYYYYTFKQNGSLNFQIIKFMKPFTVW